MVTKMKNFLKFKTGDKNHDLRKFGEEFYLREAKLWRPFRWFGIATTLIGLAFLVAAICSGDWVTGKQSGYGFQDGIWYECYGGRTSTGDCITKKPHWQNAVIGLMIFAASFGFVAAVLAVCGLCTSPLPKKIYYFHSAGEIFLVCALSTTVALIIYPIAISLDSTLVSPKYGKGYGLGWGGTLCFFAAALCMSLDDLVRESSTAKCCKWCWRSRNAERTELQQV